MSYIQKLLTFAAIFLSIVIPAAVLADTPAQQFQTQLQALIGTFRSQITASTTSAADIQTLVTIFQTELQDLQNQLRSAITSEIQVTRPTLSGERFCQAFSQNMGRGSTDATAGGEVTKLQQLLAQDSSIYPEGLVTGFFGSATEGAVQRAQKEGSVVSAGTPDTTGFGFVGPATRGFFYSRWCTEASPSTSSGGAGGGTSGTAGGSGTSSGTSGSTGSGDTTSGSGSTSGGTQNVNFTATPTSGQA
ncbi:MAG: peptidoglycan-binding domain-containing protein, partial [bacterium]|nr:peptidoglycan-binding domain-containing protein [bacterium]